MFRKFLLLQFKTTTRSPIWQKNLAINIIIGFFLLVIAFYFLMLGLFIEQLMNQMFPHQDHLRLFNGFIIYYFLGDILIRFLGQSLPVLFVESFQHLPIRKGSIIRYMIGRTVFDVFNLLPLFIFIPVTFTIVIPHEGSLSGFLWLITLIILILSNNFLVIYLKRLLGANPAVVGILGLLFISLIISDYTKLISLSGASTNVFGYFTHQPLSILLLVGWLIFTYRLQYHFLSKHFYTDEVQKKKMDEIHDRVDNRFLKSMGITGSIILLEFRLYLRNKRTRALLYMSPFILLWGFFMYSQNQAHNQDGLLLMAGVLIISGMMLNYTIHSFANESSYFDCLLTKNIDLDQYIRVKYYISIIISSVFFILSIPYLFYGYEILLVNAAMYFYSIGILSLSFLYFATFNKKRIDLSRGGTFNYQGMGASNWLSMIPAIILPFIIFRLFRIWGLPRWGIVFIGFLGILGLFYNKTLIRLITRSLQKQKYIMTQNFRER
jgi:hypothetical protein